MGAEEVRKLV